MDSELDNPQQQNPAQPPPAAAPAPPPATPAASAPAPAQPDVQHLPPGENDQIPLEQQKADSWGAKVYHGILNALGGSSDVTLARDPQTGKMVATAVKSGPGQQWKRIISGAVAGAGAAMAGGGTGPGSTGRKFGLGIQAGAGQAQQRQQQQQQNANEDFEMQQKAATSNAQNALLSHQIAESTFRLGRQKVDAAEADSERETNFTKMIADGGEGSQDMGVFPDFPSVIKAFKEMPQLHDHQANGKLVTIPHVDGNGKVDGVHVALVTPDWLSSKTAKDIPITMKSIKDGKLREETFTIPGGSITNDQASKLLMGQSKDALDEFHKAEDQKREAGRAKAQNTKDYADAAEANAQARMGGMAAGGAALSSYPETLQNSVKGLADYSVDPATFPTRTMAKGGQMDRETAIGLAKQIDPSYDETQFKERSKTRADFGSGHARQTINSLNTAVQHLGRLNISAANLDNGHFQPLNAAGNWLAQKGGDQRVTVFKADANAVANEMATVFKGTGATDQEIKTWHDTLSASQSPKQLRANINELVNLMDGRLKAIDDQWKSSMGTTRDFHILSPQSAAILHSMGADSVVQSDTSNFKPKGAAADGAVRVQPGEPTAIAADGRTTLVVRGGQWVTAQQ